MRSSISTATYRRAAMTMAVAEAMAMADAFRCTEGTTVIVFWGIFAGGKPHPTLAVTQAVQKKNRGSYFQYAL